MSLSLSTMRSLVRRGLGNLTATDLSDTDVDLFLNMSLWGVENNHWFKEKECRVTIPLVDGQWRYGLPTGGPTLDAIITVSVFDTDGDSHLLDRASFDKYAETFDHGHINYATPADFANKRGQPTKFFREDNAIYVWDQVPDDSGWVLELLMWKTIASLTDQAPNPDLPRNWHEIVVEGAITRGHYYNQDYNLARQAEDFRVSHVRQAAMDIAKEERNSRYAAVEVPTDWPE